MMLESTPGDAVAATMPDWERQVRDCEESLRAAFLAGDTATVAGLLADGYHANSPFNKLVPAPVVLKLLGAGTIRNIACDSHVELIQRFGDTAVVMGQDDVVDPPDERRYQRRFTDVWQWQGARWRLVARHAHVLA